MKKINDRESDISEWYLDIKLIAKYLDVPAKDAKRSYHHTAPVSNVYALHEALRLVLNEGLDNVEKRHRETAKYFWDKLESTELDNGEKFQLFVKNAKDRVPTLTTVCIPKGVDGVKVC